MRTRLLIMIAALVVAVPGVAAAQPATDPLNQIVKRMTLPQKVGQLFATYVYGSHATAPSAADADANKAAYGVPTPAEVVAKYHLGEVIYFTWSNNLNDPLQIATLSNGLQTAAAATGANIPLLVSTDQEQGSVVWRMPPPATAFPGAMALGAGRSRADAYVAAQITGRELRAVGITQALAPVADVNVNPANPVIGVRSFSSDPGLAAEMVSAQVNGLQGGANAAATAKHFPGHGDTGVDSHTGIPIITHTVDEWWRLDAPPFQAAIAAGIDSIMTAHIVVPALDPSGDPATLSRPILTGILRDRLGFGGVIITDALTMAGVRDKYGDERVPVLALKAGADMLLMPPNLDLAYNAVLDAVRNGELTESRIDQSVHRILKLKQRRGLLTGAMVDVDAATRTVGRPDHLAAAQDITDRTVTAIRNDANVLPFAAAGRSVLVTGWDSTVFSNVKTLGERLAARGIQTTQIASGSAPSDAKIAEVVGAASTADLTVVMTNNARGSARQQQLVKELAATGRPLVVVAVRDAYDIAYFTEVTTYLATFSYTPPAMESLARVVLGERSPRGRLPVAIPVAGDPTTALYPFGYGLSW
jgi:beta-N-acetylhexosaminidase